MSTVRFAVRLLLVAIVCAAGTSWLGWLSVPLVGFIYGMVESRVPARGSIAALGASLAWAGLLSAELARGADIRLVAAEVGAMMHMPAGLLVVATLVFGALLAGTAAVVGAGIGSAVTGLNRSKQARAPGN